MKVHPYFPSKYYLLTYFVIFAVNECQLELEFCRINAENAWLAFTVQAENLVALHTCNINWKVQCADYSMISTNKHTHIPLISLPYQTVSGTFK